MSQMLSPHAKPTLLPKDWAIAPLVYCRHQPIAALIFVAVNLVFGTVGLWLPLLNGWYGGGDIAEETNKLLRAGGLYLYVVAFLAAIVGAVFASLVPDSAEHSRGTKTLLAVVAIVAFFVCTLLMQAQLFQSKPELELRNLRVQAVVSFITFLATIYIHAIIQNETTSSTADDLRQNAKALQSQAATAEVSAKDFE